MDMKFMVQPETSLIALAMMMVNKTCKHKNLMQAKSIGFSRTYRRSLQTEFQTRLNLNKTIFQELVYSWNRFLIVTPKFYVQGLNSVFFFLVTCHIYTTKKLWAYQQTQIQIVSCFDLSKISLNIFIKLFMDKHSLL